MNRSVHVGENGYWHFDNTYTRLTEVLYRRQKPETVANPRLVVLNRRLAEELDLNSSRLEEEKEAAVFAGSFLPAGADPIAQAYAGHQFGHFTRLGDGRALLLGEHLTSQGARYDIQLKGSGRTPFSRNGDGKAALGPMLREYLISEAMHALSIPTTRSLAVVATGETVWRQNPLPGAVLTRVAASHIRVGTFEYAASLGDETVLNELVEYTLRRHFPEAHPSPLPAKSLLEEVVNRQASLIAKWLHVGFIHGVMNTDNMALSGETIDYGPCAFMDEYDPKTVFSSIDHQGRYAYSNQPSIAQWNLARLAEALLSMLAPEKDKAIAVAQEVLQTFASKFESSWWAGMQAKLGLATTLPGDRDLVSSLLGWMQKTRADYTNTFRSLTDETWNQDPCWRNPEAAEWLQKWQVRLSAQDGLQEESIALRRAANPVIIPRNHLVEETLVAAEQAGEYGPFFSLLEVLQNPFQIELKNSRFTRPPGPGERVEATFCGT